MMDELIAECQSCAEAAAIVDYSDTASVERYNENSDRMRAIVDEVVELGPEAGNSTGLE